ncbi:hypothetical protein ZIOFF_071580 [Zingiber officinale]|uniref:Coiled-coil domain-containing protein SCD2 n=1 Tax=Zingiber officinale TaxID=94328 RepID=A0A8J5EBJ1_ZINOF|nr:hypothetical protein ZIOFF_071580 [Zingiber officinale]
MEGHRRADSSTANRPRKYIDDDQGKSADAQGGLANGRPRAAAAANARLAQMMMRVKSAAEYDEEEHDPIPSIVGGGSSYRNGSPRLASFRGSGGGASTLARNPSSLVICLVNSLADAPSDAPNPAARQDPVPSSSVIPIPRLIPRRSPDPLYRSRFLLRRLQRFRPLSPIQPPSTLAVGNSRLRWSVAVMDRMRAGSPAYSRQGSGASSGSGSSSPGFSPGHSRSVSASSLSGIRRTQNLAAKAASARLAQVMATQATDDEDEDDLVFASGSGVVSGIRYGLPRQVGGSNGGVGAAASSPSLLGRSARSPSPAVIIGLLDQIFMQFLCLGRNFVESVSANRSSSVGRTTLPGRMTPMVPPAKTTARSPSPIPAIEPPVNKRIGKRFPEMGMGPRNPREPSDRSEAFALQDKLDMVEEENYSLLEKLQLAEERCQEAEARSRELEKQVANLGEGVSLEARLLSRKEAALRQREDAIKSAIREKDENSEELTALRQQVESARDEVATIMDQFKGAELEINALSAMTQRMVLSQEEMEEVVLKRCWLARYWALAVQHGIYPEIAAAKHEYWSSLAPIPLEVVASAGQKAKDEFWSNAFNDSEKRNKLGRAASDAMAEGNIESMLAVEKGLRELASIKVEDAVILALAEHRRPNLLRQSTPDFKSPGNPKFMEAFGRTNALKAFELSQEEMEDVLFKQSWLTYFWRRAKTHSVEEDIADDRLQFWIDRMGQSPTSHDVVDGTIPQELFLFMERGLIELRKLGIEQQLWEACRREIDAHQKPPADAEENL